MVDLSSRYLGMTLRSPVVASASPLTGQPTALRALDEAGVGAVVLPSLFEEQITHDEVEIDRMLSHTSEGFAEALTFFPDLTDYNTGPDQYLELVGEARQAVSCPVIASLNGTTEGGWVRHARLIEEAGADALELNIYLVAADFAMSGEDVEQQYVDLVEAVRRETSIPLAVKVGPQFTSIPATARRLEDAGADALVLFNRFYQPDIDLETLGVTPNLVLSTSDELRLPLRWIAILAHRVGLSLALTTGVHTAHDVVKSLLAGADVAMTTSALLERGPGHVATLIEGLREWMVDGEYDSVAQMKGSVSQATCADPATFERANYIETLTTFASPFPA